MGDDLVMIKYFISLSEDFVGLVYGKYEVCIKQLIYITRTFNELCWIDALLQLLTPGPAVIKPFSYSTQLSTEYFLLINVKMPAIVGILTLISMINTTSERLKRLKARNFFICRYFSFYEQLKVRVQLS